MRVICIVYADYQMICDYLGLNMRLIPLQYATYLTDYANYHKDRGLSPPDYQRGRGSGGNGSRSPL